MDVEEFHPKNFVPSMNGKFKEGNTSNSCQVRGKERKKPVSPLFPNTQQPQTLSHPSKLSAQQRLQPPKGSKRSIIEFAKHIEDQNIDLKRSSIGATALSSEAAQNSNNSSQWQCLVKTKGKKTKVVVPVEEVQDIENNSSDGHSNDVSRTSSDQAENTQETATVQQNPGKSKKKPPKTSRKSKGKKSGKNSNNGKNQNGGFEVIEPDFGAINLTKRKTESVVAVNGKAEEDEEEEDFAEIFSDEEKSKILDQIKVNKLNVPYSSSPLLQDSLSNIRHEDNVIDLIDDEDCQELEKSLLNFTLNGDEELILEALKTSVGVSKVPSPVLANGHLDDDEVDYKDSEPVIQEPILKEATNLVLESQNQELKINTNLVMDNELQSAESSSAPSSLSSPIPTDDGRDGSNSESDDAPIPELKNAIQKGIQQNSQEQNGLRIADSVTKWLNEKQKEGGSDQILRIPKDPQLAKIVFRAMYGVEFTSNMESGEETETGDEDEDEDDDLASLSTGLSADESDLESDLKPGAKGMSKNGKSNPSQRVLLTSLKPKPGQIDTDSDYMSDGQNMRCERVAGSLDDHKSEKRCMIHDPPAERKKKMAATNKKSAACRIM